MENSFKILPRGMQISQRCDKLPGELSPHEVSSLLPVWKIILVQVISSVRGSLCFSFNCVVSLPDCFIICCLKKTGLEPL